MKIRREIIFRKLLATATFIVLLFTTLISGTITITNWEYPRFDPQNTNYYPAASTKINLQVWSEFTKGIIGATPLVINGKVYVTSFDGYLYCYDAISGNLIWKTEITVAYSWVTQRGGISTSPIYINGYLYVLPRDGEVVCVNAEDGRIAWSVNIGNFTLVTPTVVDGKYLVFPDVMRNLYIFSINNASIVKKIKINGGVWAKPAYDGSSYIYVGTGGGEVIKIKKGSWDVVGGVKVLGGVTGAIVYCDGVIYITTNFGYLYAISAKDMKVLWKYKANGPIIGGPSVGGGVVYFASQDTYVYAIDAMTGNKLWNTALRDSTSSAIAVSENYLYVFDDYGYLYCIDKRTGVVLWSSNLFGDARYEIWKLSSTYFPKGIPNVAIYGREVYAGLLDGRIVCIGEGEQLSINPLFLYLSVFGAVFFVVIVGSFRRKRKKIKKKT